MSKSLGNNLTLKNIKEKSFNPLSYRYMCLTANYRELLLFSLENLSSSENAYQRLKNICEELKDDGKINEKYLNEFKKSLEDDLNTSKTIQILWAMLRDKKAQGKWQTIKRMDEVLGLKILEKEEIQISAKIKSLVNEREKARKSKNWKKADELRDKISKLGYIISDTAEGPVVKKLE